MGDGAGTSAGVDVRRLGVQDAASLVSLRREALETDPPGLRCLDRRQPRALHWQGRFVDEHHLTLDLREQGG